MEVLILLILLDFEKDMDLFPGICFEIDCPRQVSRMVAEDLEDDEDALVDEDQDEVVGLPLLRTWP